MGQTDNKELKESRCFGIAYDKDAKECKVCEVAKLCEQNTLGGVRKPTPTKPTAKSNAAAENAKDTMEPETPRPEPKAESKKPPKKTAKKTEKNYDPSMPEDFKSMSLEDMEKLAKERGLDYDEYAQKYSNVSILRMRLTMGIKKTYEI